jgi:hypothetical protein
LSHERVASCPQINNIQLSNWGLDEFGVFVYDRNKLRVLIACLRGLFKKSFDLSLQSLMKCFLNRMIKIGGFF